MSENKMQIIECISCRIEDPKKAENRRRNSQVNGKVAPMQLRNMSKESF